MNTDGYGGLAGFSGPALGDGSPVEVVRFQDLHRKHAPASAGLPEFGGVAETQTAQAPLNAPMEYAGFAFGTVPSYGGAEYGRTVKVTDGKYEYEVETTGTPNKVVITKSPSGSVPREVTPSAGVGYTAILDKAKQQYPYDFLPNAPTTSSSTSSAPATERERAEAASKEAERAVKKEADSLLGGFTEFLGGAREGIVETVESKREFEQQKIGLANENKPPEENKALTYALWAGGALLGIGAVILIVKAVSDDDDDDKSKKKEA
jgi:hypothetical protein